MVPACMLCKIAIMHTVFLLSSVQGWSWGLSLSLRIVSVLYARRVSSFLLSLLASLFVEWESFFAHCLTVLWCDESREFTVYFKFSRPIPSSSRLIVVFIIVYAALIVVIVLLLSCRHRWCELHVLSLSSSCPSPPPPPPPPPWRPPPCCRCLVVVVLLLLA